MMTLGRGFRGDDAGAPEQTAAYAAAAALIVTAVPTAVRADEAASASAARASASPSASAARVFASPSPSPVEHLSVLRAADGPARTLPNIAFRTLSADGRLMAICSLGKRRPRPRRDMGEGMTIVADGVPTVFATAGLGTGLSRSWAGATDQQRRAPPGWNLRQATELAPS